MILNQVHAHGVLVDGSGRKGIGEGMIDYVLPELPRIRLGKQMRQKGTYPCIDTHKLVPRQGLYHAALFLHVLK